MSQDPLLRPVTTTDDLEQFSFGDSSETADALLALVLAGTKSATCSSCDGGEPSRVGVRSVVLDGASHPRALVETTEIERRLFCDVDADFARDEGEGDRSLDTWRREHRAFFERNGGFDDRMALWCERFRLVRALSPETSASAPS